MLVYVSKKKVSGTKLVTRLEIGSTPNKFNQLELEFKSMNPKIGKTLKEEQPFQ